MVILYGVNDFLLIHSLRGFVLELFPERGPAFGQLEFEIYDIGVFGFVRERVLQKVRHTYHVKVFVLYAVKLFHVVEEKLHVCRVVDLRWVLYELNNDGDIKYIVGV